MNQALVVDDVATDRQHMINLLKDAGWQVSAASDAAQGLEMAKRDPPDIIFMDIVMPGMDGYQACRRLAVDPATRSIPVVFVSTKHQRADHVWARMQGGKHLIAKPCTLEDLAAALQHAVGRRG